MFQVLLALNYQSKLYDWIIMIISILIRHVDIKENEDFILPIQSPCKISDYSDHIQSEKSAINKLLVV